MQVHWRVHTPAVQPPLPLICCSPGRSFPTTMFISFTLSVLLFAFYAFARHGFNWIAFSTSLIVSVPIGFAIAFFETQSQEFRRQAPANQILVLSAVPHFQGCVLVHGTVLFYYGDCKLAEDKYL